MNFVFYHSLKPAARKAFNAGTGQHGKYCVDGDYIAVRDKHAGRALNWVKVLRNGYGEPIKEITR